MTHSLKWIEAAQGDYLQDEQDLTYSSSGNDYSTGEHFQILSGFIMFYKTFENREPVIYYGLDAYLKHKENYKKNNAKPSSCPIFKIKSKL
jgi:hypothetical protein